VSEAPAPAAVPEQDGALLTVTDLQKHFPVRRGILWERTVGYVKAVDGVTFTIPEGKTLGLVGESGSGKSTTGYCILQLMRPTGGSIRFQGRELTELKGESLRRTRQDMQIVFQDPYSSLDPRMTVGMIVAEPLEVHSIGTRKGRAETVRKLLEVVGFNPNFTNRYPHEFSGGQRQRIGIARALALNPKLIICDEPVSALDVSIQAQILNLLKDLQSEIGLTYLFISHNLAVINYIADRIAVMCAGRIVELAPRAELFRNPIHPYTRALMSAVPYPDPARPLDFEAIDASRQSNPFEWPPPFGCSAAGDPPMLEVADGHFVRASERPKRTARPPIMAPAHTQKV
jgi:oligopeptide transport system ATP-binding protein